MVVVLHPTTRAEECRELPKDDIESRREVEADEAGERLRGGERLSCGETTPGMAMPEEEG